MWRDGSLADSPGPAGRRASPSTGRLFALPLNVSRRPTPLSCPPRELCLVLSNMDDPGTGANNLTWFNILCAFLLHWLSRTLS
jgi:hypothetical protein